MHADLYHPRRAPAAACGTVGVQPKDLLGHGQIMQLNVSWREHVDDYVIGVARARRTPWTPYATSRLLGPGSLWCSRVNRRGPPDLQARPFSARRVPAEKRQHGIAICTTRSRRCVAYCGCPLPLHRRTLWMQLIFWPQLATSQHVLRPVWARLLRDLLVICRSRLPTRIALTTDKP